MPQFRLVIAEKPSVAQSIAAVLGATVKKDGYYEGSGYRVSWCLGHLAELSEPAAYNKQYESWRLEDLPILPQTFKYRMQPEKRKQFATLQKLLCAADVLEVVNSCDAGREGELIFRTVYELAGCTKPVYRLWISSMEEAAIREGFQNLRPGQDYDGLFQAALCRAKADWLVGVNASRFFSLIYDRTLNIGRVMSPTLALLVQREAEIAAFTPEDYYTIQLDCGMFCASSERMKEKKEAEQLAAQCSGSAVVQNVSCLKKTEKAPLLYDLTTLQREANRIYGFTAQQTLDYLQSLYEKKLCTYPRTDSRYITEDMERSLPAYVNAACVIWGQEPDGKLHAKQVCDSSRVTDHHAIVPTQSVASCQLDDLPSGEREILRLVARSLLCAVSEPYEYLDTKATLLCGGKPFTAKGKTVVRPGWRRFLSETESTDPVLPELHEGQTLKIQSATVREGQTKPPAHLTEDTLLSAMENAGAKEMPENAERKELGTPATRAGVLEKLVSTGFVQRKKVKNRTVLVPTDVGKALITVLPEQLQSPQLTAEWEQKLKEIEVGAYPKDFLDGIAAMLKDMTASYAPVPGAEALFHPGRKYVGKCPRCGSKVFESQKGFFCEGRKCSFALWKNSFFFTRKRIEFTAPIAEALLRDGRVALTGCYSEHTGKAYNCVAVLTDDGKKAGYQIQFPAKGG